MTMSFANRMIHIFNWFTFRPGACDIFILFLNHNRFFIRCIGLFFTFYFRVKFHIGNLRLILFILCNSRSRSLLFFFIFFLFYLWTFNLCFSCPIFFDWILFLYL
jgi:hypothetical protein